MLPDALYPECPECGRVDGIHKAVVGPATPEGVHDVERYELACGHEMRPEAQMETGVVDLVRLTHPEYIEEVTR